MASQPMLPAVPLLDKDPSQLSVDEGWELLFQSFGRSQELFASFGGGEAYLKAERAAWEQDSSR